MPAPKALVSWLQPPTSTKRKRTIDDDDLDITSDKENLNTPPKPKQPKSRDSSTLKSTTPETNKSALKLYTATLKAIDKHVGQLDRQVKKMQYENRWTTMTDTYATAVMTYLPAVKTLLDMDEKLAFNLFLSMADASHCSDMNATAKMPGVGDSEAVFKSLDESLPPLIAKRERRHVSLKVKLGFWEFPLDGL